MSARDVANRNHSMMFRVFRVYIPTSTLVLLLSEIVLLLFCYVLAAFLVLDVDPSIWLVYDAGLGRIVAPVVAILLGLHFLDLYSDFHGTSNTALVLEIGQAVGFAFLVQAVLSYVWSGAILPRQVMLWGSGFSLVSVSTWRVSYNVVGLRALVHQRVLFLGTNPVIEEISQFLPQHPEVAYVNLGYVDDEREPGAQLQGAKVLGPLRELRHIVAQLRPDRIVVGLSERRARMPMQDLLDLHFSGIVVEDAASAYEAFCSRVCTKELRPAQLVFSSELGPQAGSLLLQSLYSPVIALAGSVLTMPVMLLAAAAIKLTSPGPVLFRQTRVGLRGAPFTAYKFRSMYVDAEAKTGAVWAAKDDPRVTPLGRWLRRLRIDELPQLWNVLRGEMAIVGPRPERPEFVRVLSERIPYYRQRHCVRPGITGWAQINYKYGDTIEDTIVKLEYDLYYIKNLSLALDLYIIFHTIKTMLRLKGAQ